MAYKQYTHCTPSADYKKFDRDAWATVTGIGGLAALVGSVIAQALIPGAGIFFILFGSASLLATIIMTFEFLLGGKLICLGGDRLAIGKVISVELPGSKPTLIDNIDNDLSINILLCPHEMKFTSDPKVNWNNALNVGNINPTDPNNYQDYLVEEQDGSKNHGLPYTGYETAPFINKPNFHIELEGARIQNMYAAFLAMWALLVIAATAALALLTIPVIGWLLALLAMLFGGLLGLGVAGLTYVASSDGDLDDIDPSIGEFHPGDLLIAYGTWTYDSGHNYDLNAGWNELHPVKYICKGHIIKKDSRGNEILIPTNECLKKDQVKLWVDKITEALDMPDLRKSVGKNQMVGAMFHPDIDGCPIKYNNDEELK